MATSTVTFPALNPRNPRAMEFRTIPYDAVVEEPRAYPGIKARVREHAQQRNIAAATDKLTHAVEYLMVNTLIARGGIIDARIADMEAIAILKYAGREVMAAIPPRRHWWQRVFHATPARVL